MKIHIANKYTYFCVLHLHNYRPTFVPPCICLLYVFRLYSTWAHLKLSFLLYYIYYIALHLRDEINRKQRFQTFFETRKEFPH